MFYDLKKQLKTCPICNSHFTQSGRRKFCSDACKMKAYRYRKNGWIKMKTIEIEKTMMKKYTKHKPYY